MAPAVLFDLDGTLLDPRGSIRGTLQAVVRQGGLAPLREDEVLIGMPLRDILRTRTKDEALIDGLVAAFRRHFLDETWRQVADYPDVMAAVDAVRDAGAATAVVTTKGQEEAEVLLARLGHRHRFDVVVGDDDVRPVKPHPAPVLAACAALGVPPREALMVGDTSYDMEAGRLAGTATLAVAWGHGDIPDAVPDAAALRAAMLAWLTAGDPTRGGATASP